MNEVICNMTDDDGHAELYQKRHAEFDYPVHGVTSRVSSVISKTLRACQRTHFRNYIKVVPNRITSKTVQGKLRQHINEFITRIVVAIKY